MIHLFVETALLAHCWAFSVGFIVPTLTFLRSVFLSLPKLAFRRLALNACDNSEFGVFLQYSQSGLRLWRASLGCLDSFHGCDQFSQLSRESTHQLNRGTFHELCCAYNETQLHHKQFFLPLGSHSPSLES